jgi:hypothetical protein
MLLEEINDFGIGRASSDDIITGIREIVRRVVPKAV